MHMDLKSSCASRSNFLYTAPDHRALSHHFHGRHSRHHMQRRFTARERKWPRPGHSPPKKGGCHPLTPTFSARRQHTFWSACKARQGKARQGKARQGKARQGKARQGKARQGKTRQDKTRQDKTRKANIVSLLRSRKTYSRYLKKTRPSENSALFRWTQYVLNLVHKHRVQLC
eukprot:SAG11_NODE_1841_length_4182_cov_4.130541_6_plen_173_part_00